MSALLLVPILACGFIAFERDPKYQYRTSFKYEGQSLYLKSLCLGIFYVTAGIMIAYLLKKYIPSEITIPSFKIKIAPVTWVANELASTTMLPYAQSIKLSWAVFISLLSMSLAFITSNVKLRSFSLEKKVAFLWRMFEDSPLERLYLESFIERFPIMITMDTGKVYVGTVVKCAEPGPDQELSLAPILSGYRETETHIVRFTNFYAYEDASMTDFTVLIPYQNIILASNFDMETYASTNENITE